MKKDKTNDIKLLGTLVNADESGIIGYASQVYDSGHDKSTEEVDTEQDKRLDNAEAKDATMQTTLEGITKTGEASAASNVTYNHNDSQLDASNVQQAIDEVYSKGNSNVEATKEELNESLQDVYKKSNYNDGDDIIDFNSIHKVEDNPEFVAAWVDTNDRLLVGIKKDTGSPYYGVGVPEQVKDYIDSQINKILGTDDTTATIDSLKEIEAFLKDFTNSDTLKNLLDLKADVDDVKATTDDIYKKSNPNDEEGNVVDTNSIISVEDNPEYIKALVDSTNKLIEAIGLDGVRKFFAGINIQGVSQCVTDNPEYIVAWLDSQDRTILAIENDGNPYFGYGVPRQIQEVLDTINNALTTALEDIDKKINLGNDTYPSNVHEITDNPEYISAIVDAAEKLLEAYGVDGVKRLFTAIELMGTRMSVEDNPEFVDVRTDLKGKILQAINNDGDTILKGINITNKINSLENSILDNSKNIASIKSEIKKYSNKIPLNPFTTAPHYYHFNPNGLIKDGDGNKAIGSQSIDDIAFAARLGFKFIEANVGDTADGDFYCWHGAAGTNGAVFGNGLKSADESVITTADLKNTTISEKTLEWIQQYVRFDSAYEKYQTKILSLAEFCQACKSNNIGIFMRYSGAKSLEMCKKYFDNNNIIIYTPPTNIRDNFNGMLYEWNEYTGATIESLLAKANRFGPPYICAVGTTVISEFESAGILDDFIKTFHDNGYLVGCAGVYEKESLTRELFERGFDVSGSGHEVNPFESNYEYFNIDDESASIETNGNVENGQITLSEGNTITCGSTNKIIGKACLSIRFNGSITVSFGSQGTEDRALSSDGTKVINIYDYLFKKATTLVITANSDAVISHFIYKTSKC